MYQYALVDTTGQYSIEKMRSYQDWYLRYALQSVPGVAEVAPLGGFVRQYQVNIDPNKLLGYKIPINMVVDAIRKSNNDVGARLVEMAGREYMVRDAATSNRSMTLATSSSCRTRRPARLCW